MTDLLGNLKNINVGLMTLRGVLDVEPAKDEPQDGTLMSEWREQIVPVTDIDSNRTALINKINSIKPLNQTPIVPSLYEAARYLIAIDGKHNTLGEMKKDIPSPITQACQPTHLVLLTDGAANWSWKNTDWNVEPIEKDPSQDTENNNGYNNRSINGPVSYSALPNQLENQFGKLLDTPVINLPNLPSDTTGKWIFDGKHSDFDDSEKQKNEQEQVLKIDCAKCEMIGGGLPLTKAGEMEAQALGIYTMSFVMPVIPTAPLNLLIG